MGQVGTVFNIQRYSIHDGDGIRTLVFMKGCPLKCLWCANPEGIRVQPAFQFLPKKCYGCGRCANICPTGAAQAKDGRIFWDKEKCNECMKCTKVCYSGARSVCGSKYTVDELLSIVMRDAQFYSMAGGGVTVSGGEPLLQSDFVAEFLHACKHRAGLSTAIETSSYASWEKAKAVFDNVDIFQMDIKHMDSATHKKLTGVNNELILDNIKRTADTYDFSKRKMVIRIPVIPGLNSSDENITATAEFAKSLGTVYRMELLPYHNLGAEKYDRTKWTDSYALRDLGNMAPQELMDHLVDLVSSIGLNVKIGG